MMLNTIFIDIIVVNVYLIMKDALRSKTVEAGIFVANSAFSLSYVARIVATGAVALQLGGRGLPW